VPAPAAAAAPPAPATPQDARRAFAELLSRLGDVQQLDVVSLRCTLDARWCFQQQQQQQQQQQNNNNNMGGSRLRRGVLPSLLLHPQASSCILASCLC
jgi:hypothetical protein